MWVGRGQQKNHLKNHFNWDNKEDANSAPLHAEKLSLLSLLPLLLELENETDPVEDIVLFVVLVLMALDNLLSLPCGKSFCVEAAVMRSIRSLSSQTKRFRSTKTYFQKFVHQNKRINGYTTDSRDLY